MKVFAIKLILPLFLFAGCAKRKTDEIIVPHLTVNFYHQSLDKINKTLKRNPLNLELNQQKIYYCSRLNWPKTCVYALDALVKQKGMSYELLNKYITYYKTQKQYDLLINFVTKWKKKYRLTNDMRRTYIIALINQNMSQNVFHELKKYLENTHDLGDYVFVGDQYLAIGDSVMATFYYSKVYNQAKNHHLLPRQYGYLLIKYGRVNLGLDMLENYVKRNPEDLKLNIDLAFLYKKYYRIDKAMNILKSYKQEDTTTYLLIKWYEENAKWDSASYYIDKLIEKKPRDRKAWWTKANMYEKRGRLSYSLKYFNKLIDINPQDTMAINKIASIRRKIEYYNRLKFERNKLEVIELKTLKKINR